MENGECMLFMLHIKIFLVFRPSTSNEHHNESKTSSKFITPRELIAQSEQKFKEAYTFEKYKTLVEIEVKKIESRYKDFDKNPERHPLYSTEKKAFWQKRRDELTRQGIDFSSYNPELEWAKIWSVKLFD